MPVMRKIREPRVRRDDILRETQRLVRQMGCGDVTIGTIAEAVQCSRGTIYNHFACREDALVALASHYFMGLVELFEKAAAYPGRPRERIFAVGAAMELFMRNRRDEARLIETVCAQGFREKASMKCAMALTQCETRTMGFMLDIVRDAVEQGDLRLSGTITLPAIVAGFWSVTLGGYGPLLGVLSIPGIEPADVYALVRHNCNMLADGYGWRPLTDEWDYDETLARIRATVLVEKISGVGGEATPADAFSGPRNAGE